MDKKKVYGILAGQTALVCVPVYKGVYEPLEKVGESLDVIVNNARSTTEDVSNIVTTVIPDFLKNPDKINSLDDLYDFGQTISKSITLDLNNTLDQNFKANLDAQLNIISIYLNNIETAIIEEKELVIKDSNNAAMKAIYQVSKPAEVLRKKSDLIDGALNFRSSVRSMFATEDTKKEKKVEEYSKVSKYQNQIKEQLFSNANDYLSNLNYGKDLNFLRSDFLKDNNTMFKIYNSLTDAKFKIYEGTIPEISVPTQTNINNDETHHFENGLPIIGLILAGVIYSKFVKCEYNFLKKWRSKDDKRLSN